jgi:two-component system, response regulator YesN
MLGGERLSEAFVILIRINNTPNYKQLYKALRVKMRELGAGWVGALSGSQIPLIIFREPGRTYRAQASSMVQQLIHLQHHAPGTIGFMGIGKPYALLEEIRLSHQEALISTADSSLPSKHRFYEDLSAIGDLKEDYPNKQLEKQFIDYIRIGRWTDVQAMMMDYIGRYEKNGFDLVQSSQRVLESLWVIYRVLAEMGIEVEKSYFSFQLQDYRELRAETVSALEKLLRYVEHYQNQVEPDVVHRIKQFIVENASKDISLEFIADWVNLSPYYISKVFKEEVGVNYIDFLTDCRMEKAKTLLSDRKLSLKEITFEIGYNDPNYFSKVFKKMIGLSPSDYRKQLFTNKTTT